MRRSIWAAWLLVALAFAAHAEPPRRTSAADYRVPERIGAFDLAQLSDYSDSDLGFRAEYHGSDALKQMLIAYVFSARDLVEISLSRGISHQYQAVAKELEFAREREGWNLSLTSQAVIRSGTWLGSVEGILAKFDGTNADGDRAGAFALVTLIGKDFVKIRGTWIGEAGEAIEAARVEFLRTLAPRMDQAPPTYSAVFLYDASSSSKCLRSLDGLFGLLDKEAVERGLLVHTFDRELGLREKLLEKFERAVDGGICRDRIADDVLAVHRAGFTRELIWETQREPYWEVPEGLRLEEFRRFHRTKLRGRRLLERFGGGVAFSDDATVVPPRTRE